MSDPAPVAPSPGKKTKGNAAKMPPAHPIYIDMVTTAIAALREKGGSSRQAIIKYITANYKVNADVISTFIKSSLKKGVAAGVLKQVKGAGASGSFKLEKVKKPAKKAVKKPAAKKSAAKKPAAKKAAKSKNPKKPAPKKKPAAKKPAAKKPAKKAAKKAAPKKKK